MKKTRFTETQIVSILKQQEGGRTTKELARENAVSEATIYNWKSCWIIFNINFTRGTYPARFGPGFVFLEGKQG